MRVVGFAVFCLFGVCLVLLGATQETLSRDLALDLTDLGLLGSALAGGIGIGVAGSGPLVDRRRRKPLFVGSALVAALALGGVEPGMDFARVAAHVVCVGLAIGVQETLVNTCISQQYAADAARPLLVVHAGATFGAALAPLAIVLAPASTTWIEVFRATALAQLALAGACLLLRFPEPLPAAPAHAPPAGSSARALLPFLWIGFAYVGVETTLQLYVVPYAASIGLGEARALQAMSCFWGGLLLGRIALLRVRSRIDARFLAAAGVAGACIVGAGVGARVPALEAVYLLAGLALGFVFPVMIALAAEAAPHARGVATGLAAGAGAAGGLVIPPLHGSLGDQLGVGTSLLTLVAWCGVMVWAARVALRRGPR